MLNHVTYSLQWCSKHTDTFACLNRSSHLVCNKHYAHPGSLTAGRALGTSCAVKSLQKTFQCFVSQKTEKPEKNTQVSELYKAYWFERFYVLVPTNQTGHGDEVCAIHRQTSKLDSWSTESSLLCSWGKYSTLRRPLSTPSIYSYRSEFWGSNLR